AHHSNFSVTQHEPKHDIERLVIADGRFVPGFHPVEIVRMYSCPEFLVCAYGARFQAVEGFEFRRPRELAGSDIPLPGGDDAVELRVGHGAENAESECSSTVAGRTCREDISFAARMAGRFGGVAAVLQTTPSAADSAAVS